MSAVAAAVLKSIHGTEVPLRGVTASGRLTGLLFELSVEQTFENEKKKNIYWINSKNYLIEDLKKYLKRFNTNILNKEASKKTECRYSTSTIESKILNEEKEIKEN